MHHWHADKRLAASLLTHPAVPLAIGIAVGTRVIPPRLLFAGIVGCMLPDADVIAFGFDLPYASAYSHRGFTHSIFFALLCGALAAVCAQTLHSRHWIASVFVSVATASHGLLDAFTNGGTGIAFLWPFSDERYFMPWQVIAVSPIGISRFLSERGAMVLWSELRWVWLPCLILALMIYWLRRARKKHAADSIFDAHEN